MSVYKCYKQDSMFGGVCIFSVHFVFNEVICIMSALLNLPTLRKTSEAEKNTLWWESYLSQRLYKRVLCE